MFIGEQDLDYFIERLKEKGMSSKRASKLVRGFYRSAMGVLGGEKEMFLPGSDNLFLRRSGDRLEVYSR